MAIARDDIDVRSPDTWRALERATVQSDIMFHRSSPSLRGHMRMASCVPGELIPCAFVWHDPGITPCCKSLFALVIKNSPGCRRDFRVKMWGTSSPDDKLTGDLGNVIEATQIGDRRSDRLMAGKLSPGNFGLLQQYLPEADIRAQGSLTASI